jgi:hypothetical protein
VWRGVGCWKSGIVVKNRTSLSASVSSVDVRCVSRSHVHVPRSLEKQQLVLKNRDTRYRVVHYATGALGPVNISPIPACRHPSNGPRGLTNGEFSQSSLQTWRVRDRMLMKSLCRRTYSVSGDRAETGPGTCALPACRTR